MECAGPTSLQSILRCVVALKEVVLEQPVRRRWFVCQHRLGTCCLKERRELAALRARCLEQEHGGGVLTEQQVWLRVGRRERVPDRVACPTADATTRKAAGDRERQSRDGPEPCRPCVYK